MAKDIDDPFLTVVTLAIEHNPQTLAAVKAIVAEEWYASEEDRQFPGLDLNREWRIGQAVTDALHMSIGHPGGIEPDDVQWEYTILMNFIYHVSDKKLGAYCMKEFRPDFADEEQPR